MKKEEIYVAPKTKEDCERVVSILKQSGESIWPSSCIFRGEPYGSSGFSVAYSKDWSYKPRLSLKEVSIEELAEILGVSEKITKSTQRSFETGSVRDSNVGKPRVADLLPYTRQRFGYHMLLGAEKYGEGNFELGQPDKSSFESIHRHLASLEAGDKSEDHASAIIFGLQLVMQNQQRDGVAIDHFYNKLKTK